MYARPALSCRLILRQENDPFRSRLSVASCTASLSLSSGGFPLRRSRPSPSSQDFLPIEVLFQSTDCASGRGSPKGFFERKSIGTRCSVFEGDSQPTERYHDPLDDFFDRRAERQHLSRLLYSRPSRILVILGPRSSGKTALLKEVFQASQVSSTDNSSSQDSQASDGSMAEPRTSIPGEADPSFFVSYIDAREQRISQPADLARALQKAASNLKSRMLYAMQLGLFNLAKANFGNLTFSLDPVGKAVSGQQDRTPALAEIIQTYGELLAKFSQGRQNRRSGDARMPWPVLCIDQANQLTAWAEDDRNEQLELDALLNFFVRVTKQDKQCHVILATSDYSFLPWLSKRIYTGFLSIEVIGDFTAAEGREFLQNYALPGYGHTTELTNDQWSAIFQVTGGNPGLLISAAAEYNGDWESSLLGIWTLLLMDVQSAMSSRHPWTPRQFIAIASALLADEHHALQFSKAILLLGSDGHQVLEAMVAANLLAYRPVSDWSRDLPPELHGERCEALVTASSAAHLYAMHILQAAGDFGALPEGQGSEVSGAVPSPDPEMAPVMAALQTVELQIDRIEQKEEKLESEKPEFWREDLRQLRREEEQLRRKKEQLREEELLLLRNQ